jgi:hypothetical protein
MKNKGLRRRYDVFNWNWFDWALPDGVEVRFAKLKTAGLWTLYEDGSQLIEVQEGMPEFATCITLMHEMIHVKGNLRGWEDHTKHGPRFLKERKRLLHAGAFDDWI